MAGAIDTYLALATGINTATWHAGNAWGKSTGRNHAYLTGSSKYQRVVAYANGKMPKSRTVLETMTAQVAPAPALAAAQFTGVSDYLVGALLIGPAANFGAGYSQGNRTARTQATIQRHNSTNPINEIS